MNRFGRLTQIALFEQPAKRTSERQRVLCVCDCGTVRDFDKYMLRYGRSKSCGCIRNERFRTHGEIVKHHPSTEYTAWFSMKARCSNPNQKSYEYYGGRGISVCQRWLNSFENFLADMGRKPSPELQLDRINNDGNYEPGNCRWATHSQQMHNRRKFHHRRPRIKRAWAVRRTSLE